MINQQICGRPHTSNRSFLNHVVMYSTYGQHRVPARQILKIELLFPRYNKLYTTTNVQQITRNRIKMIQISRLFKSSCHIFVVYHRLHKRQISKIQHSVEGENRQRSRVLDTRSIEERRGSSRAAKRKENRGSAGVTPAATG